MAGDYDAGGGITIYGRGNFDPNPIGATLDIDGGLGVDIFAFGRSDHLFRITPSDTTEINVFGDEALDVLDHFGPGVATFTAPHNA